MSFLSVIECGLLGLGIVFLLTPLILKLSRQAPVLGRVRDLHHTHEARVPRLGGLALAAAFVGVEVFIAFLHPDHRDRIPGRLVIVISSLAMFGLGFWDDIRPLGARRKLVGQILISLIVCCFGIGIQRLKIPFTDTIVDLHGWGVLITLLWLVGMTNLVNLVDGVDGLAGGICFMLMALLAYVGHHSGGFELLTSGMAGALLGFLWFNFPPARIYMGDGGAYFLGFQLGLFSIAGSQKGTIVAALVAPLFVLALPIVDVALAILRRGLRGLPIFRPDRRHIHHHLLAVGFSRRQAVVSIYAVTLVFLVMGFVAFWSRGQLIPVLLGIAVLVLLLCAGKLSFSREWFAVGRVLGNSLGMRQEVQYGLCLTRWLALEGQRRSSIAGLWPDLVFVAQRLGFTSVTLTLEDGARTWEDTSIAGSIHSSRHVLREGRSGILELKAAALPRKTTARAIDDELVDGENCAPCLADGRLFGIMSDLLAEGWINATRKWEKAGSTPLRFSSRDTMQRTKMPAKAAPVVAPVVAVIEPYSKPPVKPVTDSAPVV